MRIFLYLIFCGVLSIGPFQAKADLTDAVTTLFQGNESQLSRFEQLAHKLNKKVDKTFVAVKSTFSKSINTAEKEAAYILNDELLRIAVVLLISFFALFFLRRATLSFLAHHPHLPQTEQVTLEIIPWLSFWGLSMLLCEPINLSPVLRHAVGTCLTVLSIGFGLRQVSMIVYHLHHNILGEKYHRNFKRLAPTFVYYGVNALISLGTLLILAIMIGFSIAWITHRPIDPQSPYIIMLIDMAWYFYLLCFTCLILLLQQYHINKQKKISSKRFSLFISLDKFHILGYVCLFLSYTSWIASEAGWVDPVSYKLVLILTLTLLALLFFQSGIKIMSYAMDTILSWILSENAKKVLDYTFILKILSYSIYGFIVSILLAYALDLSIYFNKLSRLGDYIIEKGLAVTIVIGVVTFIHKGLNKITHRIVESQSSLKRSERVSSRLFTILLLFRNVVPSLLWIPAIILILLIFGIDSKYILYVFAIVFAAFVFVGQGLLQDIMKGLVWIAEDTIAIGDIVTVNNTINGTVEHLTFQSVSIRDYAGVVHTVSFNTITTLAHHEWLYSYAICEIAVHHEEDLDKVVDIMMKVAEDITNDPKIKKNILAPMDTPGIDNIKEYAIKIKGRIKVKPGTQYDIQREYYKKLLKSFKKSRITLPYPRQELYIHSK